MALTPRAFFGGTARRLAIALGCAIPVAVWIVTGNWLLGVAAFAIVLVLARQLRSLFGLGGGADMDAWREGVRRCIYVASSEDSGIAIDVSAHRIHLTQNFGKPHGQVARSYAIADIRNAAAAPAGIRLTIADPDHPQWLIHLRPDDPLGIPGWLDLLEEKRTPTPP